MMTEQWRPVVGYEGLYEVSEWGSVRSLDRVVQCAGPQPQRRFKGITLKQKADKDGYLSVKLCRNGVHCHTRVHILVAEAFLGPRPEWSTQVNHKDKAVANNHAENLEWSGRSHNMRHAYATYLYQGKFRSCSELAEIAGIQVRAMNYRLKTFNWSVEQAVSTPVRRAA